MKKLIVVLAALIIMSACVFAAQYHSVPIDDDVYRLIDAAVIRGAVSRQPDVRPYNVNVVRDLLNEMLSSDCFTISEKVRINKALSDLDSMYGSSSTSRFTDLLHKGYLRTSLGKSTTAVGARIATEFTFGHDTTEGAGKVLDARMSGMAYINGDILSFMSYDLNFKLSMDRIDPRARLVTDLKIDCDGFYDDLFHNGDRLTMLPRPADEPGLFGFFLGIQSLSEISVSLKDDVLTARFGTVCRDWGPGFNNLGLSGSARAFDGLELSLRPVPWFSYNVLTGALANVSLKSVNGVEWPSENMDAKEGKYSNNFSIHRVELGPFYGVKFGVWESVVWRKRFEISYLNPFTIYMFAQNALGDYDNVLAGLDLSWTLPGVGRFYAALSMDELNDANLIRNPRNILSYQVGAEFSPSFLDFSLMTVQLTYIPAFFGSHYQDKVPLFADIPYTTAYVNKGQNLSYPVNPDTLEILFNCRTSFGRGWTVGLTVKDQMRSAQYSCKKTGTDILTFMSYSAYDEGEYRMRDFFGNIWDNALDVEAGVEKQLEDFPLTVSFGLTGIWQRTRGFEPTVRHDGKGFDYNPGEVSFTGDWKNTFIMNASLGARVYY